MTIFAGSRLMWNRNPCEIRDGRIHKVKGVPIEEYNVMEFNGQNDKPALYTTFASINENNLEEITDFCLHYGLLGLSSTRIYEEREHNKNRKKGWDEYSRLAGEVPEILKRVLYEDYNIFLKHEKTADAFAEIDRRNKQYKKQLTPLESQDTPDRAHALQKAIEIYQYENSSEDIEDIKREIKIMRSILDTLYAIGIQDEQLLKVSMREIWSLEILYDGGTRDKETIKELEDIYFDDKLTLVYQAKYMITKTINEYLQDISPGLENNYCMTFNGGWVINSLISAIYLMLYLDLSKNKLVKQCENASCQQWFSVSADNMDKKYCSNSCARAQAQREYRRRNSSNKKTSQR